MTSASNTVTTTIRISGMTCGSCELLLERKLRTLPGILSVEVDYRRGTAKLTADALSPPPTERIGEIIHAAGYRLANDDVPTASSVPASKRLWIEIGASALLIFAIYNILRVFNILSLAPDVTNTLSFGGAFIIGLVAGASSCLAIAGGLLLAVATKYNEVHQSETPWEKFRPLLSFNAGRVLSYFVLGGVVGLIGQSITLTTAMNGYLTIAIAIIMFSIALSILGIIPKGSIPIRPPKALSRAVMRIADSKHPLAPFALGAGTFFLPCGFTQSLQLVALASGSFLSGALTMFAFSLGTLPALLGISVISSTTHGNASRLFLRFSGTLIFFLAIFNLRSGLTLAGIDFARLSVNTPPPTASAPFIPGEVQEVSMSVEGGWYEPSSFTIHAGSPVRWKVDASRMSGCTSSLVAPSLGINKALSRGMNVIEFTPQSAGTIAFSCSMGMARGSFTVL